MSRMVRRNLAWYGAAGLLALAASAGCDAKPTAAGAPPANPAVVEGSLPASPDSGEVGAPPAPPAPPPPNPGAPPAPAPPAPSWPTPEDCVSYNPEDLSVEYEAGIYAVRSGSQVVLRLSGGPGEMVGEQGLALAQRYRKHCYLGRDNTREDKNAYVFDYWRSPSGMTPPIADEEEQCSGYDRKNLTVEDMGGGYGWRVKDHDHVLHVFDNESDARNGRLVLSKYGQICFLGNNGDEDDPPIVSYSR